jgi:hypothetical protein
MKKLIIAAICAATVIFMTGCASQIQAVSAANTSAVISVRAAADLKTKIDAENFCTMSVDTLARNTQYLQGVKSLCWAGQVATPADTATAALTAIPAPSVNASTLPAVAAPAATAPTAPEPVVASAPVAAPAVKAPVKLQPKAAPAVVPVAAPVIAPVAAPTPAPLPVSTPKPQTSLLSPPATGSAK